MLKDKYTFKFDYHSWVQICAHLKAPLDQAAILPHQRSKQKRMQIMTLSVIKSATERLDVKLAVFKSELKFSFKQHEAMAILVANDYGMLRFNNHLQTVIHIIDKEA